MENVAILVDGAFFIKRARYIFGSKNPKELADLLNYHCRRHLYSTKGKTKNHLYRIFFYDCPPLSKKVFHPFLQKQIDLAKSPNSAWRLELHEELKRGDITLENYEDLRKLDKEEQDEPQSVVTLADELKELYALNDSMFTGDPNHVPKFTDGTVIKQQDLADMNMNGLQRIAEMIGIELGE